MTPKIAVAAGLPAAAAQCLYPPHCGVIAGGYSYRPEYQPVWDAGPQPADLPRLGVQLLATGLATAGAAVALRPKQVVELVQPR
jgi:hypothetical protein